MQRKSQENMRREAAAWVMRLKDSHSAADRQAFEHWLAQDAAHETAYDKAAASYDASGILRTSKIGRRRDLDAVFGRRKGNLGRSLAVASVAGLLMIGAYELSGGLGSFGPMPLETVMLSTTTEEQNVTLADGSTVSLAPASQVRIELGRTIRLAEVRKGRVRITVANERRPFRIIAGKRSAEASVGVFEAQVLGGEAAMKSGETAGSRPASNPKTGNSAAPAARQMLEFRAEPLGQAIGRINEFGSGPRLELDHNVADLRVTGLFRPGDRKAIAQSLAVAFNLKLVRTPSGTLRLAR